MKYFAVSIFSCILPKETKYTKRWNQKFVHTNKKILVGHLIVKLGNQCFFYWNHVNKNKKGLRIKKNTLRSMIIWTESEPTSSTSRYSKLHQSGNSSNLVIYLIEQLICKTIYFQANNAQQLQIRKRETPNLSE